MSNLTEDALRGILSSDFKLWEAATTSVDGQLLTKAFVLPHGIGEFTVTFKGVKDATGRRNAAGAWGQAVRDIIDDTVGDEAVTARAAQAAARIGADTSSNFNRDGSSLGGGAPVLDEETVPASSAFATPDPDSIGRVGELQRELFDTLALAGVLAREIEALTAYYNVLEEQHAQEIQEQEDSFVAGEGEEGSVTAFDATPESQT